MFHERAVDEYVDALVEQAGHVDISFNLISYGEDNHMIQTMVRVIRSGELRPSPWGTVKFEGEPYGAEVSFFLVNNQPGMGPDLHRHPYSETWIVRSGKARITADGEDIEAGPGDIVVVSSDTPHKFKNIGSDRLDIICIHSSPRIIQEELEE